MNNIQAAADILKTGKWCTGELHIEDKHCALGALGAVMLSQEDVVARAQLILDQQKEELRKDGYSESQINLYHDGVKDPDLEEAEGLLVNESREARILAETILQNIPEDEQGHWKSWVEREEWQEVIIAFNDSQEEAYPVITMFEKAAIRFDEVV